MDSNTSAFTIESYGSCNGIFLFSGEFPELRDHYNFILDTNFKHNKKFSLAIYDLNNFNTTNPEIYFQSFCSYGQPIYSSASSIPYHNYNNQIIKDWDTFLACNSRTQLDSDQTLTDYGGYELSDINYSSLLFYGNGYDQSIISITGLLVSYFAIALGVLRLGLRSINSYAEEKAILKNDKMIYNFWKGGFSSNKETVEKMDEDERDDESWIDKFEKILMSSHLRIASLIVIIIMTLYLYTFLMVAFLYETERQIYYANGGFSAIETLRKVWGNPRMIKVILVLKVLCFNHFLIIILPTLKGRSSKADYWCFIIAWTVLNIVISAVDAHLSVPDMELTSLVVKYSNHYLKDHLQSMLTLTNDPSSSVIDQIVTAGYSKVLNKLSHLYSTSSLMFLLKTTFELVFLSIYLMVVTIKVFMNPSSFFLTLIVNSDKDKILNGRFYKNHGSSSEMTENDTTLTDNDHSNSEKSKATGSVSYLSSRKSTNSKKPAISNIQSNNKLLVLNPKAVFLSVVVIGLAVGQMLAVITQASSKLYVFIISASSPLFFLVSMVSYNMYIEYINLLKGLNEVSKMKEDFYKSHKLKGKKKPTEYDELPDITEEQKSEVFLQELVHHTEYTHADNKIIDDLDLWGASGSTSTDPNLKTYYYNLTEE